MLDLLSEDAKKLYNQLVHPDMPADGLAMCLEVARMKQRLDQLEAVLTTGEAFNVVRDNGGELTLKVDSALQEARQLTTVFRQSLDMVKRCWPDGGDGGEADVLDDL